MDHRTAELFESVKGERDLDFFFLKASVQDPYKVPAFMERVEHEAQHACHSKARGYLSVGSGRSVETLQTGKEKRTDLVLVQYIPNLSSM